MCALMDPARPDHDPRYGPLLIRMAADPARYPPPAVQAGNLARSLWDWAVSGFSMASDAEVARRLAICAGCPEWVGSARRCRLCGCHTDAKVKARVARCPADRW
jgi:hypothetical protein